MQEIKDYLLNYQQHLCDLLEKEEGGTRFCEDDWQHPEGGGGKTRILTGNVLEKAAVNFSHIHAKQLPVAATLKRPELANTPFQAVGVSIIIHPFNPFAPTTHANFRFISVEDKAWWFGGGFDLTPYFCFAEDNQHWHETAKAACQPFGDEVYQRYKKWCDDYFYLKHRNEPRGIGGLFFDDLNEWTMERCFDFVRRLAEHFILGYLPILTQRKTMPFTEQEKQFQLYRRGRYVEFNLLYDRGTLFGLQSQGRTESILASLPPQVNWIYNKSSYIAEAEEKLLRELRGQDLTPSV